ncbi:MAG: alpha/beta hydrolase [Campylobacterota bacterium]|nr:alpha/beta hydrolase [Campylobacterota bacterium]
MTAFTTLLKVPFAALGGYVILIAMMTLFQSKLVYFPSTNIDTNPQSVGLEYESIIFDSNDKTKLHAWYIPKEDANTTLLFLHGNGGNISHRLDSIKLFNSLGLNVFIFDYRGYGNSEGSANEQNTYDDARSAWDYLLKNKGIKAESIIIFGRSLGGAIAANLGSTLKPKGIILESTFTTVKEFASDAYPFVPEVLIRFNYETTKYLKNIDYPLLVVHSEDDNIIPFKYGEAVFKNANEPKTFLKIRGDHNHGFLQSKDIYLSALKKFLQECDR